MTKVLYCALNGNNLQNIRISDNPTVLSLTSNTRGIITKLLLVGNYCGRKLLRIGGNLLWRKGCGLLAGAAERCHTPKFCE